MCCACFSNGIVALNLCSLACSPAAVRDCRQFTVMLCPRLRCTRVCLPDTLRIGFALTNRFYARRQSNGEDVGMPCLQNSFPGQRSLPDLLPLRQDCRTCQTEQAKPRLGKKIRKHAGKPTEMTKTMKNDTCSHCSHFHQFYGERKGYCYGTPPTMAPGGFCFQCCVISISARMSISID
jgi:hypothetical protein